MNEAERDERARRRAVARAHHPDLGGDVEEFVRAMRTVSGRPASSVTPGRTSRSAASSTGTPAGTARTTIVVSPRSRVARAARTAGRSLTALARRRLPRSFPGSRRYGHL